VYQALVMSVLLYGAEIWTLLVADMKILVTSYVIDAYLCLAVLHAWTHDALRLMVDTYDGRKPMASWRLPPADTRNVCLNEVQEDANALPLSIAVEI